MRKQFIKTIEDILDTDLSSVLLLNDIGVFGFRDSFKKYPDRVYNIGILEQTTIGLASGLSKVGFIPFVHTIAPFIVERSLEQLKIDFGYQNLNGNFVCVGASYDYTALGPTHHCPADVMLLQSIPNMQIMIPGNSYELDLLVKNNYKNGYPTYYRISESKHSQKIDINPNKASIIKQGNLATVICFGDMLDFVIESSKDLDVTILYYTSINPFDSTTLYQNFNEKIIIVEQFYEGSVNYIVNKALLGQKYSLFNIGIKHEFLDKNGTKKEMDRYLGLDIQSITEKISLCIK